MTNPKTIPSNIKLSCEGCVATLGAHGIGSQKNVRRTTFVGYAGTPVDGMFGRMVVDMEGLSVPNTGQRPLLLAHNNDRIVGFADTIKVEGGRLTGEGNVLEALDAGKEVAVAADAGLKWQMSIGFNI